jgi:hypothetical protein
MKAYLVVRYFGDVHQNKGLCDTINRLTIATAFIGYEDNPVIKCELSELGGLLLQLASFDETNWIEYTVQFEC